jgi:outer membrane protein insertion porin family
MRATARVFSGWCVVVGLVLALGTAGAARAAEKEKEAQIDVSGLGWWGNFDMGRTLERLLGKERGSVLSANAIEDAMFLLMSAVQENGYLKPTILVEMTTADGKKIAITLDADMNATVPHDLAAKQVNFTVNRGTHYFLKSVTFSGLQVLPEKTARGFFIGEETLFANREARTYTPGRLSRGLQSVEAELRNHGHAEAKAQAKELKIDDKTGEVTVVIEVNEGVPWRIAEMRVDGLAGSHVKAVPLAHFVGQPWTEQAQQDAATEVRRAFYAQGYPDVRVTVKRETGPERDAHKDVVVSLNVTPGEQVKVGTVRFEGRGDVKEPVLRRRVRAQPGDLLNTTDLAQARYRISRLGVFERVDVSIEPPEGETRDVVFKLTPGRRLDVNLLAGYGSYEELRGGIELRQYNLFGVGHQARGQLVESMKSTRGEYRYTVPELFGESIDGSARIFGLNREEVAFQRQEFGGNVTLSAPFPKFGVNATLGYTYEALKNTDNELETSPTDDEQVIAASIDAGITRDRRDNPLTPHRGYRGFARIEAASQKLGGEADYQRIEMGIAYHTPWQSGRWVHLSAAHGVILTLGNTDENLPVNKRFYPGGDGSIRSYKEGEAAPRAADGSFIGAKSYVSASVELEQALAQKWSAVIFLDALGTAAELENYPFDETLYGLGAGLRYQTLIGPLRAEYAYNLKQRPGDPSGTFLVTIGFPF